MTKPELINVVSEKVGATKKDTKIFVDTIFDVIADTMATGESVNLYGFGSFNLLAKDACERRNPQTGEMVKVAAKNYPKFKASKSLKEAVNA